MLNSDNISFNKYWEMFYNYILNKNIVFSTRKPFKRIKLNAYSSTKIDYLNYNNITYEYTDINIIDTTSTEYFFSEYEYDNEDPQDNIIYNNFVRMINEDLSKEYKINSIQFRYFSSHKINAKVENHYLLGLIDYNIFLLKHHYHHRDYYESYNLLKLVDKEDFLTSFEQFYFKNIC
jgi:hypothetical protein